MFRQAKTFFYALSILIVVACLPCYAGFEGFKPGKKLGTDRELARGLSGANPELPSISQHQPATPAQVASLNDPQADFILYKLEDGTPAYFRVVPEDGGEATGEPLRIDAVTGELCIADPETGELLGVEPKLKSKLASEYLTLSSASPESKLGQRWGTFSDAARQLVKKFMDNISQALTPPDSQSGQSPSGPAGTPSGPHSAESQHAPGVRTPYESRKVRFTKSAPIESQDQLLSLLGKQVSVTATPSWDLTLECLSSKNPFLMSARAKISTSGKALQLSFEAGPREGEFTEALLGGQYLGPLFPAPKENSIGSPLKLIGSKAPLYRTELGIEQTNGSNQRERIFIQPLASFHSEPSQMGFVREIMDGDKVVETQLCQPTKPATDKPAADASDADASASASGAAATGRAKSGDRSATAASPATTSPTPATVDVPPPVETPASGTQPEVQTQPEETPAVQPPTAQPTAAQPTAAQPTAAQPTAAQPTAAPEVPLDVWNKMLNANPEELKNDSKYQEFRTALEKKLPLELKDKGFVLSQFVTPLEQRFDDAAALVVDLVTVKLAGTTSQETRRVTIKRSLDGSLTVTVPKLD